MLSKVNNNVDNNVDDDVNNNVDDDVNKNLFFFTSSCFSHSSGYPVKADFA